MDRLQEGGVVQVKAQETHDSPSVYEAVGVLRGVAVQHHDPGHIQDGHACGVVMSSIIINNTPVFKFYKELILG